MHDPTVAGRPEYWHARTWEEVQQKLFGDQGQGGNLGGGPMTDWEQALQNLNFDAGRPLESMRQMAALGVLPLVSQIEATRQQSPFSGIQAPNLLSLAQNQIGPLTAQALQQQILSRPTPQFRALGALPNLVSPTALAQSQFSPIRFTGPSPVQLAQSGLRAPRLGPAPNVAAMVSGRLPTPITIRDLTGRMVLPGVSVTAGRLSPTISLASMAPGIPSDRALFQQSLERFLEATRPALARRGLLSSGIAQEAENRGIQQLATQFAQRAFERGLARAQQQLQAEQALFGQLLAPERLRLEQELGRVRAAEAQNRLLLAAEELRQRGELDQANLLTRQALELGALALRQAAEERARQGLLAQFGLDVGNLLLQAAGEERARQALQAQTGVQQAEVLARAAEAQNQALLQRAAEERARGQLGLAQQALIQEALQQQSADLIRATALAQEQAGLLARLAQADLTNQIALAQAPLDLELQLLGAQQNLLATLAGVPINQSISPQRPSPSAQLLSGVASGLGYYFGGPLGAALAGGLVGLFGGGR